MSQPRVKAAAGAAVVAVGLIGSGAALAASSAPAAKTAPCSQSGIQTLLKHPGTYDFRANCALTVTRTFLQRNGTVVLNANGHKVTLSGSDSLASPIFDINGGSFTLTGVTVQNNTAAGFHGASGQGGVGFGTTGSGAHGETGSPGFQGENAQAAGMTAGPTSQVLLQNDTFANLLAVAGTAGNGGDGGNGDSGPAGQSGGAGAAGGAGGLGGNALGGAIVSSGQLVIIGGTFKGDFAIAGAGGNGGKGGAGGVGGSGSATGGTGGTGGAGGNGGEGRGGAIYSSGVLSVRGTAFTGDGARGGAAGNGNVGGGGGSPGSTVGQGGAGAPGGNGGNGGKASGGAIYATGRSQISGLKLSNVAQLGGAVSAGCPASPENGCGGTGGASGANSGLAVLIAADGAKGSAGAVTGGQTDLSTPSIVPMTITTKSLPKGRVGEPYTAIQLTATGGITPYTWTVSGLPKGLGPTAGGIIAGRPTKPGTYHVTVTVHDPDAAKPAALAKHYTLLVTG